METQTVMLVACCWEVDNMLLVLDLAVVDNLSISDIRDKADHQVSSNIPAPHTSSNLSTICMCPVYVRKYTDSCILAVLAVL